LFPILLARLVRARPVRNRAPQGSCHTSYFACIWPKASRYLIPVILSIHTCIHACNVFLPQHSSSARRVLQLILAVLMMLATFIAMPLIMLFLPCLLMEDDDCCCPEQCLACEMALCGRTSEDCFTCALAPIEIILNWMDGLCIVAYGTACDDC